ncbi:MAG: hypothetical protein KDB14_06960 [Planctomycetales bacterium]|nr:hypothetical protein [Planctomycetales bacterium]
MSVSSNPQHCRRAGIRFHWSASLLVLIAAAGCGNSPEPPETSLSGPLSIEQWRTLPTDLKYSPNTFERIRAQVLELQDERAWSRFMIETVVPERRRDLPDDVPIH